MVKLEVKIWRPGFMREEGKLMEAEADNDEVALSSKEEVEKRS